MADAIKVAVRVRPFNARETKMGCSLVIQMKGNQVLLGDKNTGEEPRKFSYDYAYWTHNSKDSHFADNTKVYEDLGKQVYDLCWDGYNACLFAYGQTGAGKSYSMWGRPPGDLGIVPRLCTAMFTKAGELNAGEGSAFIEVNYLEVYCERVMDLLNPANKGKQLKVREHPTLGPYVEGLSSHAVSSAEQLQQLFDLGQSARTVAATQMNSESSRSHSVFMIKLTVTQPLPADATQEDKDEATVISKINLVDLAGSERQDKTQAKGQQLKEAANINKSLLALGQVISTLAKGGAKVPYRDSVLTWLLKESLGGNSKTIMIAAISPASDNVEETLSTLRYADMVKKIKNNAVKMEGETARMLREMREEIERLKAAAAGGGGGGPGMTEEEKARLEESESLMKGMTSKFEDRVAEAADAASKAAAILSSVDSFVNRANWRASVANPDEVPRLIFMSHDDALNGSLVLPLRKTEGHVLGDWSYFHLKNMSDSRPSPDTVDMLDTKGGGAGNYKSVPMSPPFVGCAIFGDEGETVLMCLPGGRVYVNGSQLEVGEVRSLEHKDRVFAGANNAFLFANGAVTEEDTSGDAWTKSRDEVYSKKSKFSAFTELYEVREAELLEQKRALEHTVGMNFVSTLQGVKVGKDLLASKHARGWSRKVSERNKQRVQDAVLDLMPGIDEANHLAQMANRTIFYSIELRSQAAKAGSTSNIASRKNLFPVVVATDTDADGDGEADDPEAYLASQQQTWTVQNFKDRLLRMRMYCRDLDGDGVVDGLDGDDPFFDTHGKMSGAEVEALKSELERLRALVGDDAAAGGGDVHAKHVAEKGLREREKIRMEEENAALIAQLENLGVQPVHALVGEDGEVKFDLGGKTVSLHEAKAEAQEQAERRTFARQASNVGGAGTPVKMGGAGAQLASKELAEENEVLKKELEELKARAAAGGGAGNGFGTPMMGALSSPGTPGGSRTALQQELAELRDQLKTAHKEAHELSHAIAEEARAIASELGKDLGF